MLRAALVLMLSFVCSGAAAAGGIVAQDVMGRVGPYAPRGAHAMALAVALATVAGLIACVARLATERRREEADLALCAAFVGSIPMRGAASFEALRRRSGLSPRRAAHWAAVHRDLGEVEAYDEYGTSAALVRSPGRRTAAAAMRLSLGLTDAGRAAALERERRRCAADWFARRTMGPSEERTARTRATVKRRRPDRPA